MLQVISECSAVLTIHFSVDGDVQNYTMKQAADEMWLVQHQGFNLCLHNTSVDEQTVAIVSTLLGVDEQIVLELNRGRHRRLTRSAKLHKGTELLVPLAVEGTLPTNSHTTQTPTGVFSRSSEQMTTHTNCVRTCLSAMDNCPGELALTAIVAGDHKRSYCGQQVWCDFEDGWQLGQVSAVLLLPCCCCAAAALLLCC